MKKILLTIILTCSLIGFTANSHAQSSKTITLKDGSIVKGDVVRFQNNIYTIMTAGLGQIDIPDSQIVSIAAPGANPTNSSQPFSSSGNPELKGQVQQMQNSVLSDPKMVGEIQKLMEDKEIMAILSDKNFVNDMMSYDPNRIQANQKTKTLMQNPQIQNLINQINQKMSTGKQ